MKMGCVLPGLILLATGFAMPASAGEIANTYSRHDYEACRELPSPEPDVIDLRECDGFGGFKLRWVGAPDATWIEFSETETGQDLKLGSFFVVGTTIEWRGPVVNGVIDPQTAIVRYHRARASRASLIAAFHLPPFGHALRRFDPSWLDAQGQ